VVKIVSGIKTALSHSIIPILSVAVVYFVSVTAGIIMVHAGNQFALSYRDKLVSQAQSDTISTQKSELLRGLADFRGNSLAAATDTLLGFGVIFPYPLAVYRGWVGGIVSVDSDHTSRLIHLKQALYYLSVIFLQLLGYSLAAGAGIRTGLAVFQARPKEASFFWFRIPKQSLIDIFWIYILVLPIFLIASLWEFLSPWN
jgi:hypothetical protein